MSISLECVFHYREQWINSRSTSEALKKEYYLFSTKEGSFKKIADDPNKAFILFVEKVEALIESENNSTLQVLTRESKQEEQQPLSSEQPNSEKNKDI
jgi:hypothetical protein